MASGARTVSIVRAGYWIFGRDSNRPVAAIPSELFTHLYAGFAKVGDDGRLVIPDEYLDQFQEFTRTVRVRNPGVKTLLSIGGEGETPHIATVMADRDLRQHLIEDSKDRAQEFGFDGLDLCWMYPSNAEQNDQLSHFLYEWRSALYNQTNMPKPLLLTAAVFHHPVINTFNYPIEAISRNLDWINVLAIDFYTPSNSSGETGPVHGWRTRLTEPTRCGSDGIQNWINSGVATKKLLLALPFYGYEWNLVESDFGFFAPARVGQSDSLSYRDIQEELRPRIYETVYDRTYEAVYSHQLNGKLKWIGYDDGCSISGKVSKALFDDYNLGGYFAWHLEDDDLNWTLSRSAFESSVPAPAPEANP